MKKSKQTGVPITQLLSFEFTDNGITTKEGSYTFYRYSPPNMDIMTEDEIAKEIAKFAELLDSLGREFTIFATDKVEDLTEVKEFYESLPLEYDYITSEILREIENTEASSLSVQRAFYFVFKDDKDEGRNAYNVIRGKGYQVKIATKEELVVLMRNYLSREFGSKSFYTIAQEEIDNDPKLQKAKEVVRNKEILRRILPGRMDFQKELIEQGGTYRKVIAVKNFPGEIHPRTLQKLAHIRNTSFTMRTMPMNPTLVRNLTNQQLSNRQVKIFGSKRENTESIEAQTEAANIIKFFEEVAQKQGTIYTINVYIEMYGKTAEELEKTEDLVMGALAAQGITREHLWYEQKKGFMSALPIGADYFGMNANNMPSSTLAATYPCSYSSRLDIEGMPIGHTIDGGFFFLDILSRDMNITNSNITVTGGSGQGKSWLKKKIITFLAIRGVRCYVLDPDNEYMDLIRNLGGTVVNCATDDFVINPFEVRMLQNKKAEEEFDRRNPGFLQNVDYDEVVDLDESVFFQHLSWLEEFFNVLFVDLDRSYVAALMLFTRELYEKYGIDKNTDFSVKKPQDYPIFSDLFNYIQEKSHSKYDYVSTEIMDMLLLRLDACVKGSLSHLLNKHTNITNSNLICFAIKDLLQGESNRTRAILFNIITYVWNIIARREGPVLLDIDELYTVCDRENMTMVRFLQSFAKRSRKYDAILSVCTQQLADCLHPDIAHYTTALFNNSSTKFFFYPDKIDLSLIKEKLQLTDGEANCISMSNKEHCLCKVGNDNYYIHVGELPYEKELFGAAGGR